MVNVESWLAAALADAERRSLPELKPLLETLARSTSTLRRVDDELRRPSIPAEPRLEA
jgi:hypothetical protein